MGSAVVYRRRMGANEAQQLLGSMDTDLFADAQFYQKCLVLNVVNDSSFSVTHVFGLSQLMRRSHGVLVCKYVNNRT
jgi:hypothetical protein